MPAKVALLTYSMYGHIDKLADAIEEGLKAAAVTVSRFQFPETLAPEVLAKIHAPSKKSIPVLTDPAILKVSPERKKKKSFSQVDFRIYVSSQGSHLMMRCH